MCVCGNKGTGDKQRGGNYSLFICVMHSCARVKNYVISIIRFHPTVGRVRKTCKVVRFMYGLYKLRIIFLEVFRGVYYIKRTIIKHRISIPFSTNRNFKNYCVHTIPELIVRKLSVLIFS